MYNKLSIGSFLLFLTFAVFPAVSYADTPFYTQPIGTTHSTFQANLGTLTATTSGAFSAGSLNAFDFTANAKTHDLPILGTASVQTYTDVGCAIGVINYAFPTVTVLGDNVEHLETVNLTSPASLSGVHCIVVSLSNNGFFTGAGQYYLSDGAAAPNAVPQMNLYGTAIDTSTHIETVTPVSGSTIATSTAATFAATGFVNSADYISGSYLQIQYALYANSQVAVSNPQLLFTTLNFPITSSGAFSFSTTSPATRGGIYTMQTQIRTPSLINSALNFLGFGQFANVGIATATSTKFTAAAPNGFDVFVASTTASLEAYMASSTISLAACSSWTAFNLGDCLNLIFVPQLQPISQALNDFKNGFLAYAPWGYVTRIVVILSGTATTTLPAISINIPLGNPNIPAQYTNGTFTLDTNAMLQGGKNTLNTVHTSFGGDLSFQDVAEPLVKLSVALALMMFIAHDLLSMRGGRSRSRPTKLS